jgi:MFS family permease
VVDSVGWRWAFLINLPIGAFAMWRGLALIGGSAATQERRRVDFVGMVLLIVAVGAVALGIVQADAPDWSRAGIAAAIVTGLLSLAAFVAWARRVPAPLVDLALFRHRTYRWTNVATLAFGTAFAMMFFAVFFYLTEIWHYSLPRAGLAITPGPLLVIPTAIVTGRLAARHGHRPFLVGGALLHAAGGLWYLLVPGLEPAYLSEWLPALVLSGLGVGLVLPSLSAAAVHRLPPAHYAVGSAVNQATRQIGAVLGVAVTVLLIGHAGLQRGDFDALYATQIALALLTALCCLPVDTRPAGRR